MARRKVSIPSNLPPRFVAYYRVSTQKQGESGLGLDAQRKDVADYVGDGVLIGQFTEVESGRKADRPQLMEALEVCQREGATLVVAKLDRLSRSLYFVASIMHAGIDFIACDNPNANKLTIQILASVAEAERDAISERTQKALAATKRRLKKEGSLVSRKSGRIYTRLGAPDPTIGAQVSAKAQRASADARAEQMRPLLVEISRSCTTNRAIAAELNRRGVKTVLGGQWHDSSVRNLLKRLA